MEPERLQAERPRVSDSSGEALPLRIEREHLPDGRAITYYSRAADAEHAVEPGLP